MKQLEEVNYQKDLDPEIALLRVKLDALLDDLEVSTELLIRAINSPSRLRDGTSMVRATFVFTTVNFESQITKENTIRIHHTAKRITPKRIILQQQPVPLPHQVPHPTHHQDNPHRQQRPRQHKHQAPHADPPRVSRPNVGPDHPRRPHRQQ